MLGGCQPRITLPHTVRAGLYLGRTVVPRATPHPRVVRGPVVAHGQQQQCSANHSAGSVAQAADQSWDDHGPADEVMAEELQRQCPPAGVAAASCTRACSRNSDAPTNCRHKVAVHRHLDAAGLLDICAARNERSANVAAEALPMWQWPPSPQMVRAARCTLQLVSMVDCMLGRHCAMS